MKAKLILTLIVLALIAGASRNLVATELIVGRHKVMSVVEAQTDPRQDNNASQKATIANGWCDLVPLHSTRADVERLFGAPKMSHDSTKIYETKDERVDVLYSAGLCKLSGVERWNVPEDVVIKIEVTPRKNILIQDLHLDPNKYIRFQLSHPENWVQYRNKENGITVHTIISGKAEELYIITREPAAKDKSLQCTSASAPNLYSTETSSG
jgi:hypothetical protein